MHSVNHFDRHRYVAAGRAETGVSLIEVLIAVVILSFGILSAVGLQLVSKRNTIDADQQSTAAYLTYDLVERVRANNSADALVTYSSQAVLGRSSRGSAPPSNCKVTQCTDTQLAFFDLWEWERWLDGALEQIAGNDIGGLTSPAACIEGPAGGGSGLYNFTIAWRSSTTLPDNVANTCGTGLGLYGDNNEYRRTLTVQAYVVTR